MRAVTVLAIGLRKNYIEMQRICGSQFDEKLKPFLQAIEVYQETHHCKVDDAVTAIADELLAHGANSVCTRMLFAAYFVLLRTKP